jgi:hypothetical protein
MSGYEDLARLVTFRPLERPVRALMATHPDHGGDAADFADVQAAREAA